MLFCVLSAIFWVVYCWSFSSLATTAPSRVRVGGFFSPISPTGTVYVEQAEHLAAFLMAVNDINNKTDGIHDNLLPLTEFQVAVGVESSIESAATNAVKLGSSFGGRGVVAAISSLFNVDALMVSQLLNSMNVLSVLTLANSGSFHNPAAYPYVATIRPLQSRQGMVIQNMICLSSVRKIVVFAGTDSDNIQMMSQFQDESICELDVLAVISVRAELSDMSFEIEQALIMGARYFVNFLPAAQNAWMIEQGYDAGLFHDDTVIYTSIIGATNITQYFSPETDVARVLTGFFYFKYAPDYYMGQTNESITFARRWREQSSRAGRLVNGGVHVCDNTTDDSGNYLYQVVMNKTTVCTGLDFASYAADGADIHPYTALTYDGTILVAMAMDIAIRNGLNYKDPVTLLNIMVINITFNGASGPMNLFRGYSQYAYDGRGTRNAGTQYIVYNFHPQLYTDGSEDFMVQIGTFDGDSRKYTSCSPIDYVACFPPVYSAASEGSYSTAPSDTPPVIIITIDRSFSALCFAMAGIIALLVIVFGLFTIVHRRSKVIKASQPTLLWCILIGGLIAAARIVMGGLHKNDIVCSGEVWFGHMTFIIMIGSLFVKSYRVHCIVNTRKLIRVTFSAMHAFRILIGLVVAMVLYLVVTQSVGRPHMRYEATIVANQQTDTRFCAMEYSQFQTVLFVLEGLMLAVSFRVCWEIRNVPDVVNESKQISTAMSAIVLVSMLIMPIVYFLGLSHFTQELVSSFGFGFGAIVTLTLLFVPKIMVQYHLNSARLSARVGALDVILSSKRKYHNNTDKSDAAGAAAAPGDEAHTDRDAEAMMKGKTKQEKLLICQDQLRRWQVMLLAQQRAALNSNSTSSNAHSQSSSAGITSTGSVMRMEQSMLASVVEMGPDLNGGMREELFTMSAAPGDRMSSCLHASFTDPTFQGLSSGPGGIGELVVQDV
jgi:hypothetical protein